MNMIYYPFGKKAGMLVSYEDMKYRPLSESRSDYCWINEKEVITVLSFDVSGDSLILPFPVWIELLGKEKQKELGVDLIKRIKNLELTQK